MVIVENSAEVKQFFELWDTQPCYIIPVWEDLERHPLNNELSFLYVSFESEDFVLPFHHNDCLILDGIDLSSSTTKKMVWNKKGILQTNLNIKGLEDIQAKIFFNTNELYPLNDKLEGLTGFYTRLGIRDDLGKTTPIMRWIEVLSSVVEEIKNLPINDKIGKNWIDDEMIPILSEIEMSGLRVEPLKFFDRWEPKAHSKHLYNTTIYTEYNPYTITSRPSNRHGGINFGALNKEDGTRDIFIPRDEYAYLQLDYDAYHVRIMAKLIGFQIPGPSGHGWLAQQYGMEYGESKARTFRNIYGGIIDKHIPFFGEIDSFIQTFWKSTQSSGFIQTPKRRIPLEFVESPNPQKVFNYLLQAMETELNFEILSKLLKQGYTPVLYSYDAFLFEIHREKRGEIEIIKEIVESNGFPTNISVGMRYSDL